MKPLAYFSLIILLFYSACDQQSTTPDSGNDQNKPAGIMKISLDMTNAPSEVVRLEGKLSCRGREEIWFDFEMKEKSATAFVENIPPDTWTVTVNAFSSDDIIIYSGSAEVTVSSGVVTPVSIYLNPTAGSLEISVTWGDELVEIPDKNLLNALLNEGVDTNGDGYISYTEAKAKSSLNIGGTDISNLTGLEAFINLTTLWVRGTSATEINISSMTSLTNIMIDGNKLTSLDVTNNPVLRELACDNNQIRGLDVTHNPELIDLYCHDNQIPSLDVSNNPKLRVLHFRANKISEIDVSNNPLITELNCGYNQLTFLDLSNLNHLYLLAVHSMPSLKKVCLPPRYVSIEGAHSGIEFLRGCSTDPNPPSAEMNIPDVALIYALIEEGVDTNNDNFISYSEAEVVTSLNLSTKGITDMTGIEAFSNLKRLECIFNGMTSMDLSSNTELTYLNCYTNPLTSIDLSNCTKLEYLQCNMNQLTSLDLSDNISLDFLRCGGNKLTQLDVSNNRALKVLWCGSNRLSTLDLSQNNMLEELNCNFNNLKTLDLSNCKNLIKLICASNQITDLDVSQNKELDYFYCEGNQLTSLDVSNNEKLTFLYCALNQITSLDVAHNPALESLLCYDNNLTYLDVSKNPLLTNLTCYRNRLTSLNISNNRNLKELLIGYMPNLREVCVWTLPFPPGGIYVHTTDSPNIEYTTDCQN